MSRGTKKDRDRYDLRVSGHKLASVRWGRRFRLPTATHTLDTSNAYRNALPSVLNVRRITGKPVMASQVYQD
jgi:hypothetical protein